VKSCISTILLGKVILYNWGEDISSITHNSVFTSNSSGRGSYNLIKTVGLSSNVVSNLTLLAITVLLLPKLR